MIKIYREFGAEIEKRRTMFIVHKSGMSNRNILRIS